jgi:hypothetical protein
MLFDVNTFFLFALHVTVVQFKSIALCIFAEGLPCCGLSSAGKSQVELLSSLRREMMVLADFSSSVTISSCSFKTKQLGQLVSNISLSNERWFPGGSVDTTTAAATLIII